MVMWVVFHVYIIRMFVSFCCNLTQLCDSMKFSSSGEKDFKVCRDFSSVRGAVQVDWAVSMLCAIGHGNWVQFFLFKFQLETSLHYMSITVSLLTPSLPITDLLPNDLSSPQQRCGLPQVIFKVCHIIWSMAWDQPCISRLRECCFMCNGLPNSIHILGMNSNAVPSPHSLLSPPY